MTKEEFRELKKGDVVIHRLVPTPHIITSDAISINDGFQRQYIGARTMVIPPHPNIKIGGIFIDEYKDKYVIERYLKDVGYIGVHTVILRNPTGWNKRGIKP